VDEARRVGLRTGQASAAPRRNVTGAPGRPSSFPVAYRRGRQRLVRFRKPIVVGFVHGTASPLPRRGWCLLCVRKWRDGRPCFLEGGPRVHTLRMTKDPVVRVPGGRRCARRQAIHLRHVRQKLEVVRTVPGLFRFVLPEQVVALQVRQEQDTPAHRRRFHPHGRSEPPPVEETMSRLEILQGRPNCLRLFPLAARSAACRIGGDGQGGDSQRARQGEDQGREREKPAPGSSRSQRGSGGRTTAPPPRRQRWGSAHRGANGFSLGRRKRYAMKRATPRPIPSTSSRQPVACSAGGFAAGFGSSASGGRRGGDRQSGGQRGGEGPHIRDESPAARSRVIPHSQAILLASSSAAGRGPSRSSVSTLPLRRTAAMNKTRSSPSD